MPNMFKKAKINTLTDNQMNAWLDNFSKEAKYYTLTKKERNLWADIISKKAKNNTLTDGEMNTWLDNIYEKEEKKTLTKKEMNTWSDIISEKAEQETLTKKEMDAWFDAVNEKYEDTNDRQAKAKRIAEGYSDRKGEKIFHSGADKGAVGVIVAAALVYKRYKNLNKKDAEAKKELEAATQKLQEAQKEYKEMNSKLFKTMHSGVNSNNVNQHSANSLTPLLNNVQKNDSAPENTGASVAK